ncbi:MAG: transketolase [Magnetococcales bacterium]|nr:transketolase [Magnetococcales bacterium]
MDQDRLDRLCITTLRMLAADAVEEAKSGHPGLPLGAAPMAYVLWSRFLRHNPGNPSWIDRDRFILSAGHGSALLYALLHLFGYGLPLEEVRRFRQWQSRTPGHPEYGHTVGVEATTGPLGQGFAMGVGMALAERHLAQCYNQPEFFPVVNHFTYAICSDGDLMEGISSEAASLAGQLCLGKLIYLYDNNGICIEGSTNLTFSEDVARRFEAYEWHVQQVEDGEDLEAIAAAIEAAQEEEERPSLIMVRTRIGHGSPLAGTAEVHGAPLGTAGLAATRQFYNWPEERFHVPEEVREAFREMVRRGVEQEEEWQARVEACRTRYPDEMSCMESRLRGELPTKWDTGLRALTWSDKGIATRAASGQVINAIAPHLPAMIGGSADLAPSNNTWINSSEARNIHFGVREHAMGAMANGMALHGGLLPFVGTFLVFSDYMRGAIRLSALMKTPVVYVLTHDSIAVGEDGPTHQPVEHVASLRAIPGLTVMRPADGPETAACWRQAVTGGSPVALILTRQKLPLLPHGADVDAQVARGAYIVEEGEGEPEAILIATGSEVGLALEARRVLAKEGRRVRVVSMPSWELFAAQGADYRERVLPAAVKARVVVEAGTSFGWHRWAGDAGRMITVDRFGASAPGEKVLEEYGFSVANVVSVTREVLDK